MTQKTTTQNRDNEQLHASKPTHGLRLLKTPKTEFDNQLQEITLAEKSKSSSQLSLVKNSKRNTSNNPLVKQLRSLADSIEADIEAILRL